MIRIGKPFIKEEGEYSVLYNEIYIDGNKKIVWFKVKKQFGNYLCYERNDAYLIACLNYAIRNNHEIISDCPITESLLFNINTYLIPALAENNPSFHKINIQSETSNEMLPSQGAVGTGISCGVDSLNALAEHTNSRYKNLDITHLTFNNVGSHGEGERARELYKARLQRPEDFAKEYGFIFVESDSNLMDVIVQNHFKTHTYSSMFPVFCLQKLYGTYYYASAGYKFNEFNLKDEPQICCGSYELLSLQVFSTPQIKIYSEGMGLTRLNKLKNVIHYKPSWKYLNVCLLDGDNCGKCEKCVRTLLGIDALGAIDNYSEVFDIKAYKSNRRWYMQQMLYRIKDKKHDYFEMYPYFKKDISLGLRFNATAYSLFQSIKKCISKNEVLYNFIKNLLKRD